MPADDYEVVIKAFEAWKFWEERYHELEAENKHLRAKGDALFFAIHVLIGESPKRSKPN